MMMMHYEKPADIFHPVQLCVPSRHYFHETRFQFATHYREDVLILLYYLFELRGDLSQRFQHDAGVSPDSLHTSRLHVSGLVLCSLDD